MGTHLWGSFQEPQYKLNHTPRRDQRSKRLSLPHETHPLPHLAFFQSYPLNNIFSNSKDDQSGRVLHGSQEEVEVSLPRLLRQDQNYRTRYNHTHAGRKVPRSLAIDSPSLQEIILALSEVQVRWIVEEHKSYSKDWATNGRLKVEVLNDQRNPVNPKIANSRRS